MKNLAKNSIFLSEATDKTVKVIANLLHHLPPRYKYRIVFISRDLMEIIRSQQKMLVRDGKKVKEDTLPLGLLQKYEDSVKKAKLWMKNQRNIEFVEVDYADLMESPLEHAIQVHEFFSSELKPEAMAVIPDPKLYRERTNQKEELLKN